ncbi:MAG: type I restriction-modification system subunit M N-terminal domain-containing protein, partial [Bacteroidales bacterium]|nr:type I restriction-modification system subunit M N-terminal domain-containing protein [Bacteroidales bacterium]
MSISQITINDPWDDSPMDVTKEVNFIWSIANKLRGTYQSDKYKNVIIPMTIIRRFECALEPTKNAVLDKVAASPQEPAKSLYKVSGFHFYNKSKYTLARLVDDADNLASNFKSYIGDFSENVQNIIKNLEFE